MSLQLIIGILINTVTFGLMGFQNQKLGIPVSKFLNNNFVYIIFTVVYYGSFFIILLSPENLVLKIIICILMQFLINPTLWGAITGLIAGLIERRNKLK